MVKLPTFAVEQWMDDHETQAKYNIAETCADSISADELQALCENKSAKVFDLSKRLDYGSIRGSTALRTNLARLYSSRAASPLPAENILTTPGAISANYLVYYSLIGPGDHVICHYPTYQQLYEVPASLGAEVDLWKARFEKDWIPDIEELKTLIKPNTKLIVINNPNNPTGAVLKRTLLQQIIDLANEHSITIMSDEVYRPIFHSISPMDAEFPPSILSMAYSRTIATGSMSKAYALAGIRVGWIASRDPEIIEKIAAARHYTTISVSQLDEQVAAFALDPNTVHALLRRNIELAKANIEILDKFMIKHDDMCEWVKPIAGTTTFVRFKRDDKPIDTVQFCKLLLEKTGVLFLPGKCFGEEFDGYVRIGYVPSTEVLKEGLQKVQAFLRREFDDLPLAT